MSNTAKDNVLSFVKQDSACRKSANEAAIKALDEVRELCRQRLSRNLNHMMTKCDDALYGCAQMAESPVVHDLYMNAIHELKAVGGDVERLFTDRFVEQFNLGIPRHLQPYPVSDTGTEQYSADTACPKNEQASENLAICRMIDNARGQCAEVLLSLDRRIGFLIRDPDLELWWNPLSPESICEAFRTAVTETVSRLEYGSEIRPVLLNLFNEHVLGDMNAVYRELNLLLIRMGVQPQLQTSAQAPEINTGLPGHQESLSPGHATPHPESGAGFVAAQTTNETDSGVAEAVESCERQDPDEQPLTRQAGIPGDVTIDAVAMMFERILEDRNITDSMRALLGRLQIPFIKVAIRDPRFFSDRSHPARLLLDRLVESAPGGNEHLDHDDPLYRRIDSIVQTILNDSDDDSSVFGTSLEALEHALGNRELQDQRPVKVSEGLERLEEARSSAMEQVEEQIHNGCQLDFISDFIATYWKDLLLLIHAREGKESDQWKQAVSTMDDLVWSVKPKSTSDDQQRLMTLTPALYNSLREGMRRLSVPVTEQDAFLARLMHAHARVSPGNKPAEQGTASGSEAGKTKTAGGVDDVFLTQARQLQRGTWIEILGSDGKPRRAKMCWLSPITRTYLFTDQTGLNAGNYSIEELAQLFRSARARIIGASASHP
ncbi:MAG: DUF1631 domain-containing protein [Thiogranum sp.]|nr:DUF1631 domain-containing protein [Thiogranum sp.]